MTEAESTGDSSRNHQPIGGDIVFTFSYETYTDAYRRGMMRPPDRILATLMAEPHVGRLLVANPHRSVSSILLRALRRDEAPFPQSERQRLITPKRLRRADPLTAGGIERTYRRYDRALRLGSRRMGMSAPAVITTHPLVAGFCPMTWADGVLYFGRDDWASFPGRSQYWPHYREAYRRIARSGRPVAAVSQAIIDRIAPEGPHRVIPNGVEPAEWEGPRPHPPSWLDAIPAPRAVYAGTLDTRLDIEGLRHVAQACPDVHFVLVGPIPDHGHLDPLSALDNVHVHDSVNRPELVAVLRNSHVSLLAHRRTALTEAMSPLKVYEYLAAGLVVLSIDLPPVRGLGSRVILLDTVADFADMLDDALEAGVASDEDRTAFLREHSWSSRHRSMWELLHSEGILS